MFRCTWLSTALAFDSFLSPDGQEDQTYIDSIIHSTTNTAEVEHNNKQLAPDLIRSIRCRYTRKRKNSTTEIVALEIVMCMCSKGESAVVSGTGRCQMIQKGNTEFLSFKHG